MADSTPEIDSTEDEELDFALSIYPDTGNDMLHQPVLFGGPSTRSLLIQSTGPNNLSVIADTASNFEDADAPVEEVRELLLGVADMLGDPDFRQAWRTQIEERRAAALAETEDGEEADG